MWRLTWFYNQENFGTNQRHCKRTNFETVSWFTLECSYRVSIPYLSWTHCLPLLYISLLAYINNNVVLIDLENGNVKDRTEYEISTSTLETKHLCVFLYQARVKWKQILRNSKGKRRISLCLCHLKASISAISAISS